MDAVHTLHDECGSFNTSKQIETLIDKFDVQPFEAVDAIVQCFEFDELAGCENFLLSVTLDDLMLSTHFMSN